MPVETQAVSSNKVVRKTATLPAANAGAGSIKTIAVIFGLSDDELNRLIGCKIEALCSDGTGRAAITLGDSNTTLPQVVAASTAYQEPAANDAKFTYVCAQANAAINNAVGVFYLG